jgi:hypothetical protein
VRLVLVLTDAADQAIAVRGQPVDGRLEVVDLEGHVAQPQFVGHRGGRSRLVIGPDEARQLQPGTSVRRPQHDDPGAGVGDANDGVQELALHEHPRALDLKTQPDEEPRHRVEVRDGDADMVKASYAGHAVHPPVLVLFDTAPGRTLRSASRHKGNCSERRRWRCT